MLVYYYGVFMTNQFFIMNIKILLRFLYLHIFCIENYNDLSVYKSLVTSNYLYVKGSIRDIKEKMCLFLHYIKFCSIIKFAGTTNV